MTEYSIIDADGHILEPEEGLFDRYLPEAFRDQRPFKIPIPRQESRYVMEGKIVPPPMGKGRGYDFGHVREHTEVGFRLREMDAEGIDAAVLIPSWGLFFNGLDSPEYAHALCQAYNSWVADYARASPERLKPACVLPLQSVDLAIRELTRAAKELGIRAVILPTNSHGRNLDHEAFFPLYQVIQELGVPIIVHGGAGAKPAPAGSDRFDNFFFTHLVSHPFEQMIALACVTAGGVLDLFPKLSFAFMESGVGWVPYWADRLDEHYELRPKLVPRLKRKPSEHIRSGRIYFTCEPEETGLPHAIEFLGEELIMYGSDYPHFDCAWPDSARIIYRRKDIPEAAKHKLLHDNALRFFGFSEHDVPKQPSALTLWKPAPP